VDARLAWKDEARDFTPWLAEHLELEDREVGVGPFSADIIARGPAGGVVVIGVPAWMRPARPG
jgi:hypothetical protein